MTEVVPPEGTPPAPPPAPPAPPPAPPAPPPAPPAATHTPPGDNLGQQVLSGVQALPERFVTAMKEAFPQLANPPAPPAPPVKPPRRTVGDWYMGYRPKAKAE